MKGRGGLMQLIINQGFDIYIHGCPENGVPVYGFDVHGDFITNPLCRTLNYVWIKDNNSKITYEDFNNSNIEYTEESINTPPISKTEKTDPIIVEDYQNLIKNVSNIFLKQKYLIK